MTRVGVLASGGGTNLQAILDACAQRRIAAEVAVVLCNVPGAGALERAKQAGVAAECLPSSPAPRLRAPPAAGQSPAPHSVASRLRAPPVAGPSPAPPAHAETREEYDAKLVARLRAHRVDLVCLAGYMRLASKVLLDAFPNRVMNVHPALLPSFPGLHAQKQAWEYGVRFAGCTVHFVDPGMDTGPIIAQAVVPVLETDTEQTLRARILEQEHLLYPRAIGWFAQGRLTVEGRRVRVRGAGAPAAGVVNPVDLG